MLSEVSNILNKVHYRFNKMLFNNVCKRIRLTPPINYCYREDLKIVTQVQHRDIDMYLLAIKSFLYNIVSGSVYVLDDGSLTKEDLSLLEYHIPNVKIEHISRVDTKNCPKGGTWERLLYLIELSQDAYVIQLDSDTLSLTPMVEIYNAIENQQGFIVGAGPAWNKPVDVDYLSSVISNWMRSFDLTHVQPVAERVLYKLPFLNENRKYIRGCSAFTGFPKQQIDIEMVMEFSQQVCNELGFEKWSEWGSEQVTSNVMISRTYNPVVLPWPYYQNYTADKETLSYSSFVHFIGSNRFSDRVYQNLASAFIDKLK